MVLCFCKNKIRHSIPFPVAYILYSYDNIHKNYDNFIFNDCNNQLRPILLGNCLLQSTKYVILVNKSFIIKYYYVLLNNNHIINLND